MIRLQRLQNTEFAKIVSDFRDPRFYALLFVMAVGLGIVALVGWLT